MITGYVLFDVPKDISRDEVVAGRPAVAPRWRSELRIHCFDTPRVVDNALGRLVE